MYCFRSRQEKERIPERQVPLPYLFPAKAHSCKIFLKLRRRQTPTVRQVQKPPEEYSFPELPNRILLLTHITAVPPKPQHLRRRRLRRFFRELLLFCRDYLCFSQYTLPFKISNFTSFPVLFVCRKIKFMHILPFFHLLPRFSFSKVMHPFRSIDIFT